MNKKYAFFLSMIFALMLTLPAFSQEDETDDGEEQKVEIVKKKEKKQKGYLGIGFGPSFPVGSFGKSNINNDKSGYAENGYQFTAIDFGYKFIPWFGLGFSFKGANYPFEGKVWANYYAQEFGGEFTVKSKRWNYGGIYLGPFVTIPTKVVDIDFGFKTGIILAFFPEIQVLRDQEYIKYKSAIGPSISVSLSAGARWHLSKKFSVSTGVEFLRARPVFNLEVESSNSSAESFEGVYQDITVVNATLGIAWRLF